MQTAESVDDGRREAGRHAGRQAARVVIYRETGRERERVRKVIGLHGR